MLNKEDLLFWHDLYLSHGKKFIDVLEWGSGYSTTIFPEELVKNNIEYTWDSIENNEEWFKKVSQEIKNKKLSSIRLVFTTKKHEYGTIPTTFNKKYDIVVVDGVWRKFCLKKVRLLLKPDGIVIVHDAHWFTGYLNNHSHLTGDFISKRTWVGKLK